MSLWTFLYWGAVTLSRDLRSQIPTNRKNGETKSSILTVQRGGKTVCPAGRFQQMISGKYKLRILRD